MRHLRTVITVWMTIIPLVLVLPACSTAPVQTLIPSKAIVETQPPTQRATAISTESPVALLPPPLANVDFPVQAIPYPSDWPNDLHYPEQFSVVDAISGTLPESAATGWIAKLRFEGDPSKAVQTLSSFLAEKGWQIAENTELDSGSVLLVIERDNKSSGIAIIDPDIHDPAFTNIVVSAFP
jgi:hypothetical protein